MKTRYTFIHCEKELTTETVIYTVWVGHSKQETRDFEFLRSLSFNPSFYFQKHTSEVADFVLKIAQSLFPGAMFPLQEMKSQSLTVSEARRLVRTGYFGKSFLTPGHSEFRRKFDVKFNSKMLSLYGK